MLPADPPCEREIRVFISSTFRDMHGEREELVKVVFPQLRKLCEQRDVGWGEVDLRWGITDEQRAEGDVLPICLAEIRRCRPYFIGILGERYGWVPDQIHEELAQSETWLASCRGRSVTELEILHGVLNDPAMADKSLFYFRDPSYVDSLPALKRNAFREVPSLRQILRLGRAEAQRRADQSKARLSALKDRIRASGRPWQQYPDPVSFGRMVMRDLTTMIDRIYPEGSQPEPLDREAREHAAFAHTRARGYVIRQACFDRLDEHARGDGPPLVVVGESGSGKSALLAAWLQHYRQTNSGEVVIAHFIGATPFSADWGSMIFRIMGELKRRFNLPGDVPTDLPALRTAFAQWLHLAAAQSRFVLVLDGLTSLEDSHGALELVWLPPAIPAAVRMVVSTLPGRPLELLRQRGWPRLQVEPLTPDERRQAISLFLAQYSKVLEGSLAERLAASPQAANPLYLRVVLDELRQFGRHEELDRCLDGYLEAPTIDALYVKVLERYERDYERDRPGLVRDAFSALWAARRGLSESQLLNLLAPGTPGLPRAYWSPLYLAAESCLLSRTGLLAFSHDHIRRAVERRYLPAEKDRRSARLRLVDYLQSRESGRSAVSEVAWQLAAIEAWPKLHAVLREPRFLREAWAANRFDVLSYWAQLEAHTQLRLVDTYGDVLREPGLADPETLWSLAGLLKATGHAREAPPLYDSLIVRYRAGGQQRELLSALNDKAVVLQEAGDLDAALNLHLEQERLAPDLGDDYLVQASLGNQAWIFQKRGDLDSALRLHREEEQLCRQIQSTTGLARSLGNQAAIRITRGELEAAGALLDEAERLWRELNNRDGVRLCLSSRAQIARQRGDLDAALGLFKEAEQVCQDLGDKEQLAGILDQEGDIFQTRGDRDAAWTLNKRAEALCREVDSQGGLATVLGNQAVLLEASGDLAGALALHRQVEQIARALGQEMEIAASWLHQAQILWTEGDPESSMALLKRAERGYRERNVPGGLAQCLGQQAVILQECGDLPRAMALNREAEAIFRQIDDRDGLEKCLGNQVIALSHIGDVAGAIEKCQQREELCRQSANVLSLAGCLDHRAVLLKDMGRLDEAMDLHREEEGICREQGFAMGLAVCLGNQAVILALRGRAAESLALERQKERICRDLGYADGLAFTLKNQALLLARDLGRPDEALPLAEEALAVATRAGLAPLAAGIRPLLSALRG